MKKIILLSAALTMLPACAFADSSRASVDVDLHASTLGFGVGLSMPVTDNISGRLSLNQFKYTFQTTQDQINYDAEWKLGSVAALADWHLFSGVTHLTAGLIYNNNEFAMTGTPTGGFFTINNHVRYNPDWQLKCWHYLQQDCPISGFWLEWARQQNRILVQV